MLPTRPTRLPAFLSLCASLFMGTWQANAQSPQAAPQQGGPQQPGAQPGAQPAGAPGNSLTFGLGAGISNRYIGADTFVAQPFPSFEYRFDGGRVLRNSQFGFELDVTRDRQLDFGPIVRINTGRDDLQSAGDPVIEALGQVSATVEIGGFVAISRPLVKSARGIPKLLWTARASVVQATGGHDGMLVEASTGLVKPSRTWTFVTSLNATYASGSVQNAFFSVTGAGAAASGLDVFDADAGLRDIGATGVINYRFAPKWSATSILSYSRLIGDAADSPIVTERGSANQLLFGFNVAYTFF